MTDDLLVEFWGVRGGIPCAGPDTAVFGGDTACVELRYAGRSLIFDAGSGIRNLGRKLVAAGTTIDIDIIVSHCHIDHLMGLPFFAPAYDPSARIRFWAGHSGPQPTLRHAIAQLMHPPLFPVTPSIFTASIAHHDFPAGSGADLGDGIMLSSAPLNHPGGATGYRIDVAGRSFAYLTDHEQGAATPDTALARFAGGVDLLVIDASYTPEEYPARCGWGHSSWREALDLAEAAGAKRVALFHHDATHDDDAMARIEAAARRHRPGTFVAREGQVVSF